MKSGILIYLLPLVLNVVLAPPPIKQGCLRERQHINMRKGKNNLIDLTYPLDEQAAHWPSFTNFQTSEVMKGYFEAPDASQYFVAANNVRSPEHIGTHIDAPYHFAPESYKLDEISLTTLIGEGVLLDMTKRGVRMHWSESITIDNFLAWERKNGRRIRTGSIILIRTGYGDVYNDHEQYYGTNRTGPESIPYLRFPGLSAAAAEWLATHRCIAAIGIDLLSLDCGACADFGAHITLSENQIPIFENVANLHLLSEANREFNVIALPLNIKGGTGSPVRIVAVVHPQ